MTFSHTLAKGTQLQFKFSYSFWVSKRLKEVALCVNHPLFQQSDQIIRLVGMGEGRGDDSGLKKKKTIRSKMAEE